MVVVMKKKGRILPSVALLRPSTKALILLTLALGGCEKLTASIQDRPDLTRDGSRAPRVMWTAGAKLESADESLKGNVGGFMEVNVYDNSTVVPSIRMHLTEGDGKQYEVWLARNYPADAINFGTLIRSENGRYRLGNSTITIPKNFERYDTVLITQKSSGSNATPSVSPLLRGRLKVTEGLNFQGEKVISEMPF